MADKTIDNYKTIGHCVRLATSPGITYMGVFSDINPEVARLLPSVVQDPIYDGDQYVFRWERKIPTEVQFDKIVAIQPVSKKSINQFIKHSKKALEEKVKDKK